MGGAIPPVPAEARTTLDFFAAQESAKRRTRLLVVVFGLAVAIDAALVYVALASVAGGSPGTLALACLGTVGVVGLGAGYHALRLASGGGEAVAAMLGGTPVDRASQDPGLRRFVNVVEEMAVASGLPVPALYVLEREPGINAFAAGFSRDRSVVAVTRGALDHLGRDELQGVVAHELSHVAHADTRIDLQLMAAVGGLTAISLVGRVLLNSASRSSSRDRRNDPGAALLVAGLAFIVAGALGSLLGKVVRFAVARQREWLADAAAVQFTRNPDGLAGALRKIASEGSALLSPRAPEAGHLLFATGATGIFQGLFSTHPPIEERIRRLARSGEGPAVAASATQARPLESAALASPTPHRQPGPEDLERASAVLQSFPPTLVDAARAPFGACALCCALLLDEAPEVRGRQLLGLAEGTGMRREAEQLASLLSAVSRPSRLALLDLALPALDGLSPEQARALGGALQALAQSDGTTTPFEWAVQRIALRRLGRGAGVPPRARVAALEQLYPEALTLLCAVARAGRSDEAGAQAALAAGALAVGGGAWRLLPADRCALGHLDAALLRLDESTPEVKMKVVQACAATALSDGKVADDEAELVRAFAAALGVGVPRLLVGG